MTFIFLFRKMSCRVIVVSFIVLACVVIILASVNVSLYPLGNWVECNYYERCGDKIFIMRNYMSGMLFFISVGALIGSLVASFMFMMQFLAILFGSKRFESLA